VGSALGAALTNRRALGAAESGLLVKMAFAALVTAAVGVLWPAVVAWPAAALAAWIGLTWLGKAWKLRHGHEGPEGATLADVVADDSAGRPPAARQATRSEPRQALDDGGEKPGQSL
jgi:hypothetical protein